MTSRFSTVVHIVWMGSGAALLTGCGRAGEQRAALPAAGNARRSAPGTPSSVFQAAGERLVYAIGANADQNAVATDVVLGSVVSDLPRAFLQVARSVKDHTFRGQVVRLGLDSTVVTLVMNPALAAKVSAAVTAAVDSADRAIETGRLTPLPSSVRYGGDKLGSGVKVSEGHPGGG